MSYSIMISAGEASGDLHAANLIRSLHKLDPQIQVKGMGSQAMRDAGAKLLVDCADIAVVGLFEVLLNYRKIVRKLNILKDELKNNPPDLLILVDYQEFNFKLARAAKDLGIKVLFYISPQVWAWRPKRVYKMGASIDMMAVLFPFEEKFYQQADVPVRFVGHPLVDKAHATKSRAQAMEEYGLDTERKVVGIFPGSRRGEIKRLLPLQFETAELIKKNHHDIQFILPVASTLSEAEFENCLAKYESLDIKLVKDNVYDVMQVCDAIITASGTATLEIALMGIPSAITYKISPLSYAILKHMVKLDNIGLVNIVAEKRIVQEFIQHEAIAENIAAEINRILDDDDYRQQMIEELSKVKQKLGKEGGSDNIARLALELLQNS